MARIGPEFAAKLSRDIYQLVDLGTTKKAFFVLKSNYGTSIDIDENALVKGKTGGPAFIKSRTAFGLCVFGKGHYQGMLLLSCAVPAIWQIG